jgi:hypothetical protein
MSAENQKVHLPELVRNGPLISHTLDLKDMKLYIAPKKQANRRSRLILKGFGLSTASGRNGGGQHPATRNRGRSERDTKSCARAQKLRSEHTGT